MNVRVMGLKEETVQRIGFKSLAIFRPGDRRLNIRLSSSSLRACCALRVRPAQRSLTIASIANPFAGSNV
jgi:hypothetical protein